MNSAGVFALTGGEVKLQYKSITRSENFKMDLVTGYYWTSSSRAIIVAGPTEKRLVKRVSGGLFTLLQVSKIEHQVLPTYFITLSSLLSIPMSKRGKQLS
jgi:hypothetical protein